MIFLFPTQFEAEKFRTLHPTATIHICGVGMAEAAATMAQLAPTITNEEVILAGIAGSYDLTRYPIGSVVEVVSEQINELPDRFVKRYEIAPRWGLPQARGNSVNRSNAARGECDIENMEGASVAAICERFGLRFSEIRSISNHVGDPSSEWHFAPAIESLTNALSAIYKSK